MKYAATLFLTLLVFIGCRKEPNSPIIETGIIYSNSNNKAITKIFIVDPVSFEWIEAGVCYSEKKITPTINDSRSVLQSNNTNTVVLQGLNPDTEYWYRAYAILESELVYGSTQKFKTMSDTADLISIESLSVISMRKVNIGYFTTIDREFLSSSGIIATYTIDENIFENEIIYEEDFYMQSIYETLNFFNNEESISLRAFFRLFGGSIVYSEPVSLPPLKKLTISEVKALSFRCLKFSIQFDDYVDLRNIQATLSHQYPGDDNYYYCYNPSPPSCDFIVFDLIPGTIYKINAAANHYNESTNNHYSDFTSVITYTMPVLPDIGDGSLDQPHSINGIYYLEESAEEKWVKGKIIGTFSSEGVLDISPPYEGGISIAIADEPNEIYSRNAASLEFYNTEVPQEINLVEHPEVIGMTIIVKGSFERTSNKNMIIKNIFEYELLE